jgi:hypothetical protein
MSQKPRQKRKKGFEAKEGERASRRSKTRRDLSNFGVVDGDADLGEQDDGVVEGGGVGQAGLGRGGGSLLAATEGAVQAGAGDEVGGEVHFGGAARPVGAPDVLERLPIRVPLLGRDGGGFDLAQVLLHELHRVGDHERLPQNGRREEECGRGPTGRRRVVESEHTGRRLQVCGEGFLHGAQSELPRGRPLRYQAIRHGLP